MLSILNDAINNWWLTIVFAVGARQAASITGKGQFFSMFVELVAVMGLMLLVTRYIFHKSSSPLSIRYSGLVWLITALMTLLGAVVAFMLSKTVKAWSDTEFLGNVLDTSQITTLFSVFLLCVGFVRMIGREHRVESEHLAAVIRQVKLSGTP